jgi:hypothetical protein
MKIYRYRSLAAWFSRIVSLFFIAFCVLLLIMICRELFTGSLAATPTGDLVALGVSMVFGPVLGMVNLNLFADIAVRDNGLGVRYCLITWLFVPWKDVISVKPSLANPMCKFSH